jgi:hypothetical protein
MTYSFVLSCHASVNPTIQLPVSPSLLWQSTIDCTTRRSRRRIMNAGYALSDTNTSTFPPRQLTARDQTFRNGDEFRVSQRLPPRSELDQVESLCLRRRYQGDEVEGPPKKAKCHEADRGCIRLGDLVSLPGWLTSKQCDESISVARSLTGTNPNSSHEASPIVRAKISAILEEASSINFAAKAVRCGPPTESYRKEGQSTQISADKKNLLSLDVTTHARRERRAYPSHSRNKGLDNRLMPPPPPRL